MKRIGIVVVALAVVASLGLVAYSASSPKAEAFNDKCPVKGEDVDASKTTEVKVGFCCNNCKGKFEKDPLPSLAKITKLPNELCPLANKPVKEEGSVTIAFCCGNCKGKFDAKPQDYLKEIKAKAKK